MAHIFLIAGHGAGDSGAVGNGYTEAERVRALAQRIADLGGSNVTLGDTSRNWYADNGISSLNIPKDYQIIELHMDSASASARGGHVIIKDGYNPDKYDNALANFIGTILPGRSQLIVKRSDLANPKRAAAKGYGYRLVEFGFISNAEDVKIFNSKMDEIAKGVLAAFDIGVSASKPENKPAEKPAVTDKKSLVKQAQTHINNVIYANGGGIAEDGIRGTDTQKSEIMLFQHCYNLDKGENLSVDGIIGTDTESAIAATEIKKGYVGYLASFLEISLLAHGYDPKGVEWAGEVGEGCYSALVSYQKDKGYYGGSVAIAGKTTITDLLK